MIAVRLQELQAVEAEAHRLLPSRVGNIRDGKLDGRHWFLALIEEALFIVRRRRVWEARFRAGHQQS